MNFIDSHSHIFSREFDSDMGEAIASATMAGVTRQILPAIDSQSHDALFRAIDSHPAILFGAMGLHPTSINENPDWERELELVKQHLCSDRKFVAIGEVGLDLYWSDGYLKEQSHALRIQIELALEYNLPLIIHTRSAWREMVDLLSDYKGSGIRGVLHGYSSSVEDFIKISEFGDFYMGIGGVVTFKKSDLPAVVEAVPLKSILLETDAPYLAPHPHRGKRNEPLYIPLIAAKIAEIKGITIEEVARVTTRNSETLFKI